MNRNLKKALKVAFDAPAPTRKIEFFNQLPYPKATNLEFILSQIRYIRIRFWCLSVLLLLSMVTVSLSLQQGKEIVGVLSAGLPLLALTGITEISKSVSFHMTELEMSCKYNLSKITLIRLSTIGVFHLIILFLALFLFKDQSQYGVVRYALYAVTPFLLTSYVSFWVTNHVKSKDTIYICSGVASAISIMMFIMNTNVAVIYEAKYILFWSMALLAVTVLLIKELNLLLKGKNAQWNFA